MVLWWKYFKNKIGSSFLDLQPFLKPCVQFIENQRHCGATPNTLEGIIHHSDCPVDSPLLSQTPSFPHFHHFHFLMTLTIISIICLLCCQVPLTLLFPNIPIYTKVITNKHTLVWTTRLYQRGHFFQWNQNDSYCQAKSVSNISLTLFKNQNNFHSRQFIWPCYHSHFLKPNNSHPQATPWSALVVLTTKSFGCDRTGGGWTQPKRPPRWELKSQLNKLDRSRILY